jgi:glyoxylase-like metal-dependent hydrolase (beta-lactamase superfamily II)
LPGDTIRVGSAEVSVLRDSYWEAAPLTHLRDRNNDAIPSEAFKPYMDDPAEVHRSRVISFLVRSSGKLILVDAGVGRWGLWRFGDGVLLDSLRATGVGPEELDFVIPSHLHLDHIGWNTYPGPDGDPVITFPNAKYLFHQADWDYLTSPALRRERPVANEAAIKCLFPVRDADRMDLLDSERDVTGEVTILHTPGHTPGSVSVLLKSGEEAAIFIGDLAHLCVQLSEFDWSPSYETDREQVAESRRRVVEEAVGRNALVAGPHMEEGPAFGRMVMLSGRRVWQGVDL